MRFLALALTLALELSTPLVLLPTDALASPLPLPATEMETALQLEKRIVVNPPITYPDNTTVWYTGQKGVNATWDVPSYAAGYKGRLLLGYLDPNDTTGNEHLRLDPLALGFNLTDARVTFDIPCDESIITRNTYILVLMGDSGNASPQFTIEKNGTACPCDQSH